MAAEGCWEGQEGEEREEAEAKGGGLGCQEGPEEMEGAAEGCWEGQEEEEREEAEAKEEGLGIYTLTSPAT